jgi:predicted glycosyltransferase
MPELKTATGDPVELVRTAAPDWFIVDTFPRGLGGELAPLLRDLRCKKAFIHRDLNPEYIQRYNIPEFVREHYDRVFSVDAAPTEISATRTAPWLIRSAHELVAGTPRGILVCASGKAEERAWYEAVARATGATMVNTWPAMDLFPRAAVVIGGAGYNTIHECAACGVPLVARAWPRLYDRQRLRAELVGQHARIAIVDTVEEAVAAAANFAEKPRAANQLAFTNGAEEAAHLLAIA